MRMTRQISEFGPSAGLSIMTSHVHGFDPTVRIQYIAWDKKWDGELGQASVNYQLSMRDTVARPDAAHAVQRTRVS